MNRVTRRIVGEGLAVAVPAVVLGPVPAVLGAAVVGGARLLRHSPERFEKVRGGLTAGVSRGHSVVRPRDIAPETVRDGYHRRISYEHRSWDNPIDRRWLEERWAKWMVTLAIQEPIVPVSWKATETGEIYRVGFPGQAHAKTFSKYADALAGVVKVGAGRVKIREGEGVDGIGDASVAVVEIVRKNRLRKMGTSPIITAPAWSASNPVPLGKTETGDPIAIGDGHIQLSGVSGSGKSNAMSAFALHSIRSPDIFTIGIDLKDGREFAMYEDGFDAVAYTSSEAIVLLAQLEQYRQASARTNRGKNRKIKPTRETPLIRVLMDDILPLLIEAPEALPLVGKLMAQGRTEGIQFVIAIQTFHAELAKDKGAGAMIRSNFTHRLAFRTASPTMTEVALGRGMSNDYPAHQISDRDPGVFYYATEQSNGAKRARTFEITDGDLERSIRHSIKAGTIRRHRDDSPAEWNFGTSTSEGPNFGDSGTSEGQHAGAEREGRPKYRSPEVPREEIRRSLKPRAAARAEAVYEALAKGPGPWTIRELKVSLRMGEDTIRSGIEDLRRLGFAACVEDRGRGARKRYVLIPFFLGPRALTAGR